MLGKKYVPYAGLYELTLRCNMQCIHCGSSAGIKREKELSTVEWNTATKQLSDLNCKTITLLGGEPFLRTDWYDISKNIRDNGVQLVIISNGLQINDKTIAKLRQLEPYAVAISIDGGKPETHDSIRRVKGSFDKCFEVISMLKNANIPVTVVTTLNKKNFTELSELRSYLLNKEIVWQIQIAVPVGRFSKELILSKEEFYAAALFIATSREKYSIKELPIVGAHSFGYNSMVLPNINIIPCWKGCQAGISAVGIQSNGGIKGCLSLPEEFIEGNIREKSLEEIWNDSSFCSYNREFKIDNLNGECMGCKYGKKCKGGCLTVSASVTGKNHCDPYCQYLIEKEMIVK